MDENPFHTSWWQAWNIATMPLRLFGFVPMLVRCDWTKSRCRVTLAWVGWPI